MTLPKGVALSFFPLVQYHMNSFTIHTRIFLQKSPFTRTVTHKYSYNPSRTTLFHPHSHTYHPKEHTHTRTHHKTQHTPQTRFPPPRAPLPRAHVQGQLDDVGDHLDIEHVGVLVDPQVVGAYVDEVQKVPMGRT